MVVLSEAPARESVGLLVTDPRPPCSAVIARQFPIWPFAPRVMRLLLLVDPNQPGIDQRGLLRAMQHCCIGSEAGSQTNAVRAAVNAAHYVLRHHNHEVLPQAQVTASAVVAAIRGNVAYVAMVGDAAVLAWRNGRLTGQRAHGRIARPLGLDADPSVTLWSTPLRSGDRLILACGATWTSETDERVHDILGSGAQADLEHRLADALGGASVLVDHAARRAPPQQVVPPPVPEPRPVKSRASWRRWLAPLLPLALLTIGATATLAPSGQPRHVTLRLQAESLLAEAENVADLEQAHALATSALGAAQRAAQLDPAAEPSELIQGIIRALDWLDRVYPVQTQMVVRLGPTGTNVVDLAVAQDRLFTLDVVENAVRRFAAFETEQWPTQETLVVRKGAAVGSRTLDTPVAIQYLPSPQTGGGFLTIVDRARMVAQLLPNGTLTIRSLPGSSAWQRIGALSADADGNLYVLDSGARKLLEYPVASPLLETHSDLERVVEVLPLHDIYVRLDDGSVRRLGRDGQEMDFEVRPPEGRLSRVAAMASDQRGGLFLADSAHGRIVQVGADGQFVRQLRDPALAGLRQVHASADGQRLYGLVATGVLAVDVPDL
ncbi:MAG TPA: hypothetical protein VGL99_28545 [Chloroflexota bacterium]